MVISRRALSSWTPLLRHRSTVIARNSIGRQSWQQIKARGYASGGDHGSHGQPSSDIPWLASSVAVTAAGFYFIGIHKPEEGGHGHGDHGEEHSEEHAEEGEAEEEPKEEEESKDESKEEESTESGDEKGESDSDSGDEKQDTPDTSDDEGSDENKDQSSKGKTEQDDGGKNKTVKVDDAKGGVKNRKESKAAIKQGEEGSDDDTSGDKGKASKAPAGGVSSGSTSGKQEGVSNTDTKHSYDLNNDSSKSKKSEGGPDTAKVKGSVDPNRPTV